MRASRTILIAGAGIGGLSAALALARKGFRVVLLERARRLEETGAGIQLSPNASRVLIGLGLRAMLEPQAVAPEAIRIARSSGREIVRIPLGSPIEFRFGAPYWVIHRADLQAALVQAVAAQPDIDLRLGTEVTDFATHPRGVTVKAQVVDAVIEETGLALIGADGVWSNIRTRLDDRHLPRFAGRTAWRAVVPIEAVDAEFRERITHLWLGSDAHLVNYPVRAGRLVNLVATVHDNYQEAGWSAPGESQALLARFAHWSEPARRLLAAPDRWLKWALFDRAPARRWGRGPVTLLGDAAHPMLPFLAQGGAMAIEDAAVLADCLARGETAPETSLRAYEGQRRPRTGRVQLEARSNNVTYHLGGPAALARDAALRSLGGKRLLARYDWLYDWRLGSH